MEVSLRSHINTGGLTTTRLIGASRDFATRWSRTSIAGPTPDPDHTSQFPNAVREWCINTAAVDPLTASVMVNSEDGKLYRWNLSTNTLSEAVTLSAGIGEAYTPTIIGSDGTVYAINAAILNAVGRSTVPTLQSLTISPLSPSLFVGSTLQFAVTGHYSDGSTPDLTSAAAWTSSKTSVATITSPGGPCSGARQRIHHHQSSNRRVLRLYDPDHQRCHAAVHHGHAGDGHDISGSNTAIQCNQNLQQRQYE